MINKAKLQKAYDAGVLNESAHKRLIQGIKGFSLNANIPEDQITKSINDVLTKKECEVISKLKRYIAGDTYDGITIIDNQGLITKFQHICGFLLRNFTDGLVLTVTELLRSNDPDRINWNRAKDCDVLLIPDFAISNTGKGSDLWAADVRDIMALLDIRKGKNRFTFLGTDNLQNIESRYGSHIGSAVTTTYICINSNKI